MKRAGKDFSGIITPLFDTMLVQPVKEMGEDSDNPTDSPPIPIIDQPSSSSQPKKDKLSKKVQRQEAEVPQDEAEHEESVPTPSNNPQPSEENPEVRKEENIKTYSLKRLGKVGMSQRVKSFEDQESLGVPEDASKQGRVDGKDEQSTKTNDSTAGEVVTTAAIGDSVVPITNEEITLAQTLIQIKVAKPKLVTTNATTATTTRPKVKGVVVQEPSGPKFAEAHNVVVFLEKPEESDGFVEIIDFLKASSISYALTVNLVIYTSCIEQFWAMAKVQSVNGVRQLQVLVDKERVIVMESSIRRDLHLNDVEGTDCLLTATIFEELVRMGAKSTTWNEFSSSMASLITCLATYQKFNMSKYIFDAMVKHLDRGVKFLLYLRFFQVFINQQLGEDSDHPTDSTPIHIIDQPYSSSQPKKINHLRRLRDRRQSFLKMRQSMRKVLDLQTAKDTQTKEIAALKKRIQRLERRKMSRPTGLKRLSKVGMSRRVESSKDQESLGAPKDASKKGRSIENIDADVDVSLVDETQEKQNDDLMFDSRVLEDEVMHVEAKVDGKDDQSKKLDDSTASEAVTTAGIDDTAAKPKVVTTTAATTTTTRPKNKGVVVQEPSEFRVPQETKPSSSKDKGKGIMIELEVALKRKEQIALDEQIARDIQAKLDAELLEEKNLAWKQDEEANIALIES
ncbi:hypothetical protein Tco_1235484 [Tanacetum coccineum]